MTQGEIAALVNSQRAYFRSGATRDIQARLAALSRLRDGIKNRERELLAALKSDLNKPEFEAYSAEISIVYEEISYLLKELGGLTAPRRVATPLVLQPASSRILRDPLGVTLIIGPWNYPVQLLLAPLAGALAGGNCVVIKPSEFCARTSGVVHGILRDAFAEQYVAVVEGGVDVAKACLAQKYDHIFFTGGKTTGRIVMEAAAKHLTPVTLELGGKSPCLVHGDAPLQITARRIVWGKFMNAGQTCIAPDYLLAHDGIAGALTEALKTEIRAFFGADPKTSPDYARLVNERHFDRIEGLVRGADVIVGGRGDRSTRYFEPTLVRDPGAKHPLMNEEIFGPVLPILTYSELDEAYEIVERNPKPLAFYFFSSDKKLAEKVMSSVAFGGGCVYDTVLHVSNPHLPFGGVGESGMGAYHGRFSVDTFTHKKSVLYRSFHLDAKVRYPPYKDKVKFIKWLGG